MSIAEQILAGVGGPANVAEFTRCWARLRFVVVDHGRVDEAGIQALPEVAIALTQHGQFQVALRSGLIEVHDEIVALLAR